ncbi:MAG TPA: tetratricopeptide repeat protein [Steroidobacteraceae bacterium]|nr:tetratricopeptide repeat protein [Steroidobacteraceae bacterium]
MNASTRGLFVWLVMFAVLGYAAAVSAEVDEQGLARARAAASSGDSRSAIAEYDRLLQAAPDDLQLLNESAQQLSWAKRYAEAVTRYERVLSIDPDNRFALLERAKVLSWAGRHDESVDAFAKLLRLSPDDLDARIGLARVRSWSGDLTAARMDYTAILEDHPGHPDAMLGVAQTYAWSGDLVEARRRYHELRDTAAADKDADLGIAYLDLWEGDLARASDTARRLKSWYPDDRDVAELWLATRSATAPSVAASWDQMDDTDRNLLTIARFEAVARLPSGIGLRLNYADYDARTAGERRSINSIQASAEFSPRARHQLEVMLGEDRLERRAQPGYFVTDWGLAYRFPLADHWGGWVSARREPYRYSVALIENRIVVDSYQAGVNGQIAGHWNVAAEAGTWDVSDGNSRVAAAVSARRRWAGSRHTLEAGGAFRWLDWRQDLDSGYFDPSGFTSIGATFRAFGPVSRSGHINYDLALEAGAQSFDFAGSRTSGDPYYLAVGRLGWQVNGTARLEAYAESGSYASEGAQDWRYSRIGARLVWQFGGRR